MSGSFVSKCIVGVVIAVSGFVAVCSIVLYSFIKADMMADSIRYGAELADTVVQSMRYSMLQSNREHLSQIISDVADSERVKHVHIFNKSGVIMFSDSSDEISRMVDKKAPGCRKCHSSKVPSIHLGSMESARQFVNERKEKILALIAPIYNEQECSGSSCHAPISDKKILGMLDIGLSQVNFERSLDILRLRMALFSVMLIILTVTGLSALMWRHAVLPTRDLVSYAEGCSRGELKQRPSGLEGELNVLAEIIHEMALSGEEVRSRLKEVGDDPSRQRTT